MADDRLPRVGEKIDTGELFPKIVAEVKREFGAFRFVGETMWRNRVSKKWKIDSTLGGGFPVSGSPSEPLSDERDST